MSARDQIPPENADNLASLERIKKVETDTEAQLKALRAKIDRTLAQLREESEGQVQAAREQAEHEAAALLDRARNDADAEAARLLAEAHGALADRGTAGPPDLTPVWSGILTALFGEFR